MSIVTDALRFATKAHGEQQSRGGEAYIFHCIRVALKQTTEVRTVVALLHDVVEDTAIPPTEIGTMFGPEVMEKVIALSRGKGESYADYINRVMNDVDCMYVKLADIEDNTDVHRMDAEAGKKYPMYKESYDIIRSRLATA